MNGTFRRELLAQTIIALAVCIGGWMILVQPAIDDLHEVEALIQLLRQ